MPSQVPGQHKSTRKAMLQFAEPTENTPDKRKIPVLEHPRLTGHSCPTELPFPAFLFFSLFPFLCPENHLARCYSVVPRRRESRRPAWAFPDQRTALTRCAPASQSGVPSGTAALLPAVLSPWAAVADTVPCLRRKELRNLEIRGRSHVAYAYDSHAPGCCRIGR